MVTPLATPAYSFQNLDSGIACEDTEVGITGQTDDGMAFAATDSIVTPACEGGCH